MPISRGKPTAFLTFGDPSGIGGEIILKALASRRLRGKKRIVVIGDGSVLARVERFTKLSLPKNVLFVDLKNVKEKNFRFGTIAPSFGLAAFEYVREAVRLLLKEKNGFLVTAPLHKESLQRAGFFWPGHTEMLKELTGSKEINMMFVGKKFRISLVTWHVAVKDLAGTITQKKILEAILLMHGAFQRYFAKRNPRLALCALNPHAGEGGLLGTEEKRIIHPALLKAKKQSIRIEGPYPADSLFYQAYRGAYDGVVAMYHDQGLIPFKMIERDCGVNVTLGLPFLRTSPDHGTAFDIAGKNRADPRSMIEAIVLGHQMAGNKSR